MIVVIADDITGAAEIGGIGLRYGLRVLLTADAVQTDGIDLLVLYSNTRSMPEVEAVSTMQALTKKAARLKPSLFYKKTDSVLRGHVLAELKAQMEILGMKKALLLPVNPLLGRTIKNGNYYVNGRPAHLAGFANDPEFPINSSGIPEILGATNGEIQVLASPVRLANGISIGEASSMKEIREWASVDEDNIFYAGAASFFAALLHQRFVLRKQKPGVRFSTPVLLLSGTTYQQSINNLKAYSDTRGFMPAMLFEEDHVNEKAVEDWANVVANRLQKTSKAIIAIGNNKAAKTDPDKLLKKLSLAAKLVLQKVTVKELLIEGGATAFAVIQALGFTNLTPEEELQQGVVRMKVVGVENLHLTIKPGSYNWPMEWDFS